MERLPRAQVDPYRPKILCLHPEPLYPAPAGGGGCVRALVQASHEDEISRYLVRGTTEAFRGASNQIVTIFAQCLNSDIVLEPLTSPVFRKLHHARASPLG